MANEIKDIQVTSGDGKESGGSKRLTQKFKPNLKNKKLLWLFVVVVVVAALAVAGVMYSKYHNSQKQVQKLSNPQEAARTETEILVKRVGDLVELPSGETPTVATVSDASKLKNQNFFKNAENGDKVLIFTKAKRAILFRPSNNKIIEIAPVNIGKNQNQTQSAQPAQQ